MAVRLEERNLALLDSAQVVVLLFTKKEIELDYWVWSERPLIYSTLQIIMID